MSPHRVLVPLAMGGALHRIGDVIEFAGADWKLEPIDPEARAAWDKATAEPERVKEAQDKLAGYPDSHAAWVEHHKHIRPVLPPSGPAATGDV